MKKSFIFPVFAVLALLLASCSENGVIPSETPVPNLHADGGPGHTPVPPPPPPPGNCLTCGG